MAYSAYDVALDQIIAMSFKLIDEMSVMVTVIAVLVSSMKNFRSLVVDQDFSLKNQIIMILIFGTFSIYGNYGGIKLSSGAIANVRDIGPLFAGLVGGPVIGFGAGLIGGINRYFAGGFTAIPCSLATISAGIIGGIIYLVNKKEFVGTYKAVIIAILVQMYHMGLNLILAKPFPLALETVKTVMLPMIIANALGIGIFSLVIGSLIQDKKKIKQLEEDLEIVTAKDEQII